MGREKAAFKIKTLVMIEGGTFRGPLHFPFCRDGSSPVLPQTPGSCPVIISQGYGASVRWLQVPPERESSSRTLEQIFVDES